MLDFQRDAMLRDGKTLRGRDIILNGTHEQNYGRSHASSLQYEFVYGLSHNPDGESYEPTYPWFHAVTKARTDKALHVAHILVKNLNNPVHYETNRPGLFSSDGVPLFLDPKFTYWDLMNYGMSGEDGFIGFLRDANLPSDTPYDTVLIAAGLLLVDWIVDELDNNRDSFANYLTWHAHEVAHDLLLLGLSKGTPEQIEVAVKKKMSERGRAAGWESGKRRIKAARAKPGEVISARDKLKTEGKSSREIASILATRFNVTADHIRRVLRKSA